LEGLKEGGHASAVFLKAILDACDRHRFTPAQKDGLFWSIARRALRQSLRAAA
jgi:hypothetical protein